MPAARAAGPAGGSAGTTWPASGPGMGETARRMGRDYGSSPAIPAGHPFLVACARDTGHIMVSKAR
ncbi:hypothetical protein LU298_11125 [Komagataeibacter intermedius]|uniref:hypothetical protein n=1 Tax=Komagataeibacter intermedius TaxID=66229 RepID=UPI0005843731|nr:hypothetical protein [Komagataeibacter intermedius]MCF3637046.1 hypothetical protein [Komagataeibacter intermedius]